MTNFELRKQVAEARGWQWVEYKDDTCGGVYLRGAKPGPTYPHRYLVPAWDCEIAAAWKLLEGLDVSLEKHGETCECVIWIRGMRCVTAADPHPAAAICKAWLQYIAQQGGKAVSNER